MRIDLKARKVKLLHIICNSIPCGKVQVGRRPAVIGRVLRVTTITTVFVWRFLFRNLAMLDNTHDPIVR